MFRFNRAYLLGSIVFSLIIPLQLFSVRTLFSDQINVIQLDGIVIRTNKIVLDKIDYNEIILNFLVGIYSVVAVILLFRFVLNLRAFYKKMNNNKVEIIADQKVVLVKEAILPHSFWNAIFINEKEFENGEIPSELIAHEKAHLMQKHTLDILFVEVLQILFWFNPLIILYKKAVKLNHEFLADEAVNRQFESVSTYQKLLLSIASNTNNVALASTINYQITKKRFLMMSKKESPAKEIFKVFTVGLICSVLLFVFSSEMTAQEVVKTETSADSSVHKVGELNVKQPDFPGGIIEFYKFVGQNFRIPDEASKNKVETKIAMEFMVEKDGSLSEIKIVKDAGYGIGEEAIRVLKLSPKWIPGSKDGQPVRILYSLPITIQSEK
ncbi:energy transducer TonB [Flavobacterium branchiicola]|nr:energy transducer TonB [Flavobacterium branchiicola]